MAMASVTLSAKHRIEIPKQICDAMGWRPGDRIRFISSGTGALLLSAPVSEKPTQKKDKSRLQNDD
jgi:AbrB family looped-hinge helix DNA binding protein